MYQNKKGNGWILCSSKSFPGKHYYFNVLNGETAWTLTETEVEKTKKQIQYPNIHSNYPEPKTKPPDDTTSNTTPHPQPKTPTVTPPRPKPPVARFGEAVFPVFLPPKGLPNFVWAPVPIRYINDDNTQTFEVEKPNTSSVELVNEKHRPSDDNNKIVVQIHTCKDQYVSKRFVTYNKNSDKTNQTENLKSLASTQSPPVQKKSYFSFDKNKNQFKNDTPNTFQLPNNKNKYIKNSSFVFQSTNSDHKSTFNSKLPTNDPNTFRDVIQNNIFVTPKKTTFGYGFNTPNETSYRFDTPNETAHRFDTPNETAHRFDTPNETYRYNTPIGIPKETTEFNAPGFGFHTPNETLFTSKDTIPNGPKTLYGFDIPEKDIHGFSTPRKTTFEIDTPDKTIHGFGTPRKIAFGIDTPITTEIPDELNLLENDLRNVLLQRKRKIESSTTDNENAKKYKAYNERQATPKKHVTFKLDTISDIDSSEDFSYEHTEMLTPPRLSVETISSLRRLGATNDPWYIAVDLDVLLENFDYIEAFIETDPLCRLLVPYSVYKELITTSTACVSRARVFSARNILRRLDCSNSRHRVQDAVIASEKLKSPKDQIQCCCVELMRSNIHVVLVTNNEALYKEAKEKRIHVVKMFQIQDGRPETPDVTFDIRKIKFQIPNDNCVQNTNGKEVDNTENQALKRKQNITNENHEQKTEEKYNSSVENFWRSDNSDSCDDVSQKINNLDLIEKPFFQEKETKNQLLSRNQFQKEETVNSNFLKPMTNVIITKNVSASKESVFDNKGEKRNSNFETSNTIENQDNDSQYSIFEKEIQDNREQNFIEENQFSIFDNPASKESECYKNGINKTVILKENHDQHSILQKPASKEPGNHGNDNQYSIFTKQASKNEKQSIFENPSYKESENHENDNKYSNFKNSISENYGNDNQNSIFEIDSNFMPLTSKTIEDYLKTFNIKNKMVEDSLRNTGDEKICSLRQIMEDLSNVLQESSPKTNNSRACVLYNTLQKIIKTYGRHKLIGDVIEKLKVLLYESEEKMRVDLLPTEIMQAIGCGILLVQLLKELKPSEYLTDIEKGLNELIKSIENPANFDFLETPITLKRDKNGIYGENRINFTKEDSEIIQYLKKHYPAWTYFDETTTCEKQKPEIKIFRTFGKNLNLFKLNRSRIIVEKAIKNDNLKTEPNSIGFHENDRTKTGNIEKNNPTVINNEENDKITNYNIQKAKKTETSMLFENFDLQNELKNLKNTEKTEPNLIRLFSNDKEGEKTNFDFKKDVLDSKTTNFDRIETDSHINHENTFGPTESGPKVVRNIALIPKYESFYKKTVQNGHQGTEISLSDTENVTEEDFFLQNPKIDSKYQRNYEFSNNKQSIDNIETTSLPENYDFLNKIKCYTVTDGTSNYMIDKRIENKTLKAAISTFFKEIKICFENIQNFIASSINKIKKTENNTEIKSIENTAKKIHSHIVRIIEKLSTYIEARGENMNFSFSNLLDDEGNSTEIYITKCRHLSSLCIEQAKILEKMVIELCGLIN